LSGRTLALQYASTDASGRFELRALTGQVHRIQAAMPRTEAGRAHAVVETVVSVGDTPVEGITLVLQR
jgi:hypothetical protein